VFTANKTIVMTHNEKRIHWIQEGLIGLGVGVLYGTTSVAVGHPFDTIKTKMQAQKGFEHEGMIRTFARTVKAQGIREAAFLHFGDLESTGRLSLLYLKLCTHISMDLEGKKFP